MILGHAQTAVIEAIQAQAEKGTSMEFHCLETEIAELVVQATQYRQGAFCQFLGQRLV